MDRKLIVYRYSLIIFLGTLILVICSCFSDFFRVKARPNDFYLLNSIVILSCVFVNFKLFKWIQELHYTIKSVEFSQNKIILHLILDKNVELAKESLTVEKKKKCCYEQKKIIDVYLIYTTPKEKYLVKKSDLTIEQIEELEKYGCC